MKKVTVTEDCIRTALGASGYSRLADNLITRLFVPETKSLTKEVARLRLRVKILEVKLLKINNKGRNV